MFPGALLRYQTGLAVRCVVGDACLPFRLIQSLLRVQWECRSSRWLPPCQLVELGLPSPTRMKICLPRSLTSPEEDYLSLSLGKEGENRLLPAMLPSQLGIQMNTRGTFG